MTTNIDTTTEFRAALTAWDNLRKASDDEVASLISCAERALSASDSAWEWGVLARHLQTLGGLNKDAAQTEAKRCRIVAALGRYPNNSEEFIALWLARKGYRMTYSGEFEAARGISVGLEYVLNELKVWTEEKGAFKAVYDASLRLWISRERIKIVEQRFHDLAFDPSVDPEMTELQRWIDLVVRDEGDPDTTARNKRGVFIAITNFIHRTKNHLGAIAGLRHPTGERRWHHYSHVMPVLYGTQEDGKSLAVKVLMRAIEDLSTGMGFEVLEDNSKQNMLSYMPVMTFDELAGLKNANVEKLKGMMTEEIRSLRDAYERASPKRIVTTFIGCTNEDINGLVRDKSGNRRFFQFATKRVDVAAMKQIDAAKIWRSVNENAVSPWLANADDLRIVKEIQAEQRHKSSVEDWIENCPTVPTGEGWMTTRDLYQSYFEYVQEFHGSEVNSANVIKFGRELSRLHGARHPQIEQRFNSKVKSNQYRISRSSSSSDYCVSAASALPLLPAANSNSVATTIRHDDLGFPLHVVSDSEPTSPSSDTSSSSAPPLAVKMMEAIMREGRA